LACQADQRRFEVMRLEHRQHSRGYVGLDLMHVLRCAIDDRGLRLAPPRAGRNGKPQGERQRGDEAFHGVPFFPSPRGGLLQVRGALSVPGESFAVVGASKSTSHRRPKAILPSTVSARPAGTNGRTPLASDRRLPSRMTNSILCSVIHAIIFSPL